MRASRSLLLAAGAWIGAALLLAPAVQSVVGSLTPQGGAGNAEVISQRGILTEIERSMLNHVRPVQHAEARIETVQMKVSAAVAHSACAVESVRAGAEKSSFAGMTEQPITIRLRCPPADLGQGLVALRTLQPAFLIETAAVDASTVSPTRTDPLLRVEGSYWVVAPQTSETKP